MNLSYIDWYLVEIRRRLHGSLPLDQLNSFEFETRNHLECQSEDFVTQGMDQKSAQIAAIERFGTPEDIADRCLESAKKATNRLVAAITGLAFILFVLVNQFTHMNSLNGYSNTFMYGSSMIWLILGFGLFALFIGRVPKFRWFLLPAVTILALGTITGYKSTFYVPVFSSSSGPSINYAELHQRYSRLKSEHYQFETVEHQAAEDWRGVKANAKDLGRNATLTIPRIVYTSRPGSMVYYASSYGPNGEISGTAGEDRSATVFLDNSVKIAFQYMPIRKELLLVGPLSKLDVQKAAQSRINEVQTRRLWRDSVLGGMQKSLNIPVSARIISLTSNKFWQYLFFVGPLSYCVAYFVTRVRGRVRVKTSKMKLA